MQQEIRTSAGDLFGINGHFLIMPQVMPAAAFQPTTVVGLVRNMTPLFVWKCNFVCRLMSSPHRARNHGPACVYQVHGPDQSPAKRPKCTQRKRPMHSLDTMDGHPPQELMAGPQIVRQRRDRELLASMANLLLRGL